MIIIKDESPNSPDALHLMDELSESLESITGNSGKGSFNPNDIYVPRALFVIARNKDGEAIGCGAIRPINRSIAEVKRMYAKIKGVGIGTAILAYLEEQAQKMEYSALWLETRLVNQQAIAFYECKGYHRIPNYGKYAGNSEAVCFEKLIASVKRT
jgi:N-acetylglutamate synthase-like GNAT family acetyltransferase